MLKNINTYYFIVLLLITISVTHSQEMIDDVNIKILFGKGDAFTAFRLNNKRFRSFAFGDTNFSRISYTPNTTKYFNNIDFKNVISSNTISLRINDAKTGAYQIEGAEITFKKKVSIQDLGYSLITERDNIESQYYLVAFFSQKKSEGYNAPYARMILFLDDKLEVKAELVSTESTYFVNSSYNFFKNDALDIKQGAVPGIFILEKESQKVVAVTNTISKKILWTANNLTYHDRSAMLFFTGALQTMQFSVGNSSRLLQQRRVLLKDRKVENEKKFIIQESEILAPDELTQ